MHDFNCGIKAYKKSVVKEIEITDGMHRYIPVLAKNCGFNNISEKVVKHHPRKYGTTKYGADRFMKGFLDLEIMQDVLSDFNLPWVEQIF